MPRTAIVFSPIYYRHRLGKGHPESAERLQAIVRELSRRQLMGNKGIRTIDPERATVESVELVHGIEYIRLVEAVCRSGGGMLDLEDTQVSRESFEVALHAVGGVLKAARLVMAGEFQNAFALVRPPGHHAGKHRACGFCLFNNVAIAAMHLVKNHGLERVLILDVDAHHGNGTQEIFYDSKRVLFISLHENPIGFPGTGFTDEIGEGEGLGYSVNIPLPYGTGDYVYLKAIDEIVRPIMLQYEPQFVLISAGFDSLRTDPIGNLNLTRMSYRKVFEMAVDVASRKSGGRLVAVLEGGYDTSSIGKAVLDAMVTLAGTTHAPDERSKPTSATVVRQGERVLRKVKKTQSTFWRLD